MASVAEQPEPVSGNDATIETRDEHRIQISCATQASMCVENPESSLDIPCVLPQLKERNH